MLLAHTHVIHLVGVAGRFITSTYNSQWVMTFTIYYSGRPDGDDGQFYTDIEGTNKVSWFIELYSIN